MAYLRKSRRSAGLRAACLSFTLALQITSAFAAGELPTLGSEQARSDADAVASIIHCITQGEEAVLLREGVKCAEYRKGADLLDEKSRDMPLKIDPAQICSVKDNPIDTRRLSGDAIRRIISQTKSSADPRGVRIIGAAFCEKVDLTGLNLNHSLVVDRSLFSEGLEVRNFHTLADLSFDGSVALGEVTIMRSSIGGSVWGSNAYIQQLRILDSEIKGSLIFRQSMIPEQMIFDTISLSGELSVRNTVSSYLLLQFSRVSGVLDLTGSQARCAYLIKKSDIKDLVAVDAGFGTSASEAAGKHKNLFGFIIRPTAAESVHAAFDNPHLALNADERECSRWTTEPSFPGTFFLSDTTVGSSLCFRSFNWVAARPMGALWGNVRFNDVKVGATSLIDLAPPANVAKTPPANVAKTPPANVAKTKEDGPSRKFEAIGIKTHSLIFNFAAGAEISDMFVGGLEFEHAYAADAVTCEYDPNYYKPASNDPVDRPSDGSVHRPDNVGRARSQMRLPGVAEIMLWLKKNCLQTTQPLSTFIDAAKKAGDVTDATELQIAREEAELTLRTQRIYQRIFGGETTSKCIVPVTIGSSSGSSAKTGASPPGLKDVSSAGIAGVSSQSVWSFFASLWDRVHSFFTVEVPAFLTLVSDIVSVLFGHWLRLVADNGYRPYKVGWLIVATIVGAWIYFWVCVRVVGFMPANKNVIRPIGVAFLFDRLLPAYRLREEHYAIEAYYKWPSKSQRTGQQSLYIRYMKCLWFFNLPLLKADETDVQWVERGLDGLKLLGIIFAIFLVAAFNTIFNH
jgi:hypothetical protein